jgi:hypothetical protein
MPKPKKPTKPKDSVRPARKQAPDDLLEELRRRVAEGKPLTRVQARLLRP